jgi:hypothetical protein
MSKRPLPPCLLRSVTLSKCRCVVKAVLSKKRRSINLHFLYISWGLVDDTKRISQARDDTDVG